MVDVIEQVCEAIDQIVNERLKNINYDTTIVATIIDNKEAKNNKYTCSNGTSSFIAYSKENNYKLDEAVLVTIPNNDYTQQKTIVGKYVASTAEPFIFIQPFESIVDVTANIFPSGQYNDSLLANDDYDKYNEHYRIEKLLTGTVFKEAQAGFTRLGIQGQFQTCLNSLNAVKGNYGYRLEILSDNNNTITSSTLVRTWANIYYQLTLGNIQDISAVCKDTPDNWITNFNTKTESSFTKDTFQSEFNQASSDQKKKLIYGLLASNIQITEVYLDSQEMFGNPYKFQSYFEQEKVYDISSLNNIYSINLYFYQISNTFFDDRNNPIPYKSDDPFSQSEESSKLMNNLWTKDPYVCLGYDIRDFDSEQAILYTTDSDTYIFQDDTDPELNKKNIRLRWLHQYEDGIIKPVDESTDLEGYEIRWYKFRLGSPSADEYSGVYWDRVEPSEESVFNYTLYPSVNVQTEQIKVIIIHAGNVIRSNILSFTNEIEVVSKATAELIEGLSLWCEDKSYGNYYIYGQNNKLLDDSKSNEILTLSAKFADSSFLSNADKMIDVAEEAPDLTEAKSIIWEFPLNYTMIVVHGFNYSFESQIRQSIKDGTGIINDINYTSCLVNDKIDFSKINEVDPTGKIYKLKGHFTEPDEVIKVLGNTIYISRKGDEKGKSINGKQTYRIGKTYNATSINNTVKCTISKNSLNYSSTKEMSFGLMGTNGTDATIVIDFDDNKTALTAGLEDSDTIKVITHLYDLNHKEVDFNYEDLKLKCHWEWFKSLGTEKVIIEQREMFNEADNEWVVRDDTIPMNVCYLSYGPELDINDDLFLILKVTVSGYGDYDLISYKAIPIRASQKYRNIVGATEVIYSSSGYADYYRSPYELFYCDTVNEYDMPQSETVALSNDELKWSIYAPYKTQEAENKFYGELSKQNILKPLFMYTKDADPYGVICEDNEGNRLWIQPLIILQNEYPSATLNKWDGKGIEMDEEEGTIVAPAIAAGKKNDNNTFSGVMIGDWSVTNTAGDITQQTGVYGFHRGAMTYAFKEDGTAFIGKSGSGRIIFNGTKGTITSSSWDTKKIGLMMDLDDGILKMQASRNYKRVSSPSENAFNDYYIRLQYQPVPLDGDYDPKETYYEATTYSANHRGSGPYIRYFYYKKDGESTYTQAELFDASLSGKYYFPIKFKSINLPQTLTDEQKASLSKYYTKIDTIYTKGKYSEESSTGLGLNYSTDFSYYVPGEMGYITLSAAEENYPLGIGTTSSISSRNFRVKWDGTCYITDGEFSGKVTAEELYSDYGYIGGWEIDSNSLTGGLTVLNSSTGIFTNRIGIVDKISSANESGLLGEIGLVQGLNEQGQITYNIGIISRNQSIVLDTLAATGATTNIAFKSKGGTWAQCSNFYVMGNSGGWMSKNQSIEFHTNKLVVSTPNPSDQYGIYARFAPDEKKDDEEE